MLLIALSIAEFVTLFVLSYAYRAAVRERVRLEVVNEQLRRQLADCGQSIITIPLTATHDSTTEQIRWTQTVSGPAQAAQL